MRKRLEEHGEVVHFLQDWLFAVVFSQKTEVALYRSPSVWRKIKMPIVKCTPPDECTKPIRPRCEKRIANISRCPCLGTDVAPHVARLFGEARPSRNTRVEKRLRRGMKSVPERVERLIVHVRSPERIWMSRKDIDKFALVAKVPCGIWAGRKGMHPADDGARGIFKAYRRSDFIEPRPRLAARRLAEAVALVPDIPGDDGGARFHIADEMTHKPHLPHPRIRICYEVEAFKPNRSEHASTHPSRQKPDNELHVAPFRHLAELAESCHHLLVHAGRVLERPVVLRPFAEMPGPFIPRSQRLEIRPEGKYA